MNLPFRFAPGGAFPAALSCLLLLHPGLAQTTPEEDQPVEELSPFTVTADDDQGYVATSTLSGSRLRTPLSETPAAISEFTLEFLNDINADDVLDAIEYSIGFSEDNTSTNGNPQQFNDINLASRGVPRAGNARSVSRNYFIWFLNGDSYNTERLSLSRGPNSILFGLGDPGGMINTTTKNARLRNFGSLGAKFDNYGTYRFTLDHNQKITDKFAVRANLLYEDRDTWREVEFYEQMRGHFAATWKPFSKTTVRAEYETGEIEQVRARPWSGRDKFSGWVTAGSNLYNRTTQGNTYPAGVVSLNSNPYIVFDSSSNSFMNWQRFGRGAFGPGGGPNKIQDPSILPWEIVLSGPAASTDFEFSTWSAYLEQEITDKLYFELAYNFQTDDRDVRQPMVHSDIALFVDPNVTLPNGQPNPHAGDYYIEGQAQWTLASREVENLRASLNYELTTGSPWFGRHRWLGMVSTEKVENVSERFREVNTTPIFPTNLSYSDARNQIRRRTYLDFSSGPTYFDMDPWSSPPAGPINSNGAVGTVTPGLIRDRWRPDKTETTSYLFAGQSYFLPKETLALTYGWRRDELDQASFVETLVNGEATAGALGPVESFSGDTFTYGGVYHLFKWVSLSANFSENFSPQTALDVYERNIGNVSGKGQDYGLKLSLLQGRLSGYLGYFTTDSSNRGRIGSAFNYIAPINRIWEAIEGVGGPREVTQGLQDVEGFESEGYEVELVGRLTENLSLSANFSLIDAILGEVNPILHSYVEEFRPLWQQNAALTVPSNGETVSDQIADLDNLIANDSRQNGQLQENHRRYNANFFGKYAFDSGALKGWEIGGGAKFRGQNILGFFASDGSAIKGDDYWLFDFLLVHRRKIMGDRYDLALQLNIQNLLDRDELIFTEANSDGSISDYVFQTPRTFVLSATLKY